jgi:ferric-dicitrate binding protein FerR (iron transport regulator)
MEARDPDLVLADLADGTLAGPEWDAWLAAHPEAAAELEIARRVRAMLSELHGLQLELPADFEARLMERLREDIALLNLMDLGLAGLGRVILELLELCLSFATPTDYAAQSANRLYT